VNRTVPEIVRIGVANAQIKCVTPQRAEYLDEAGQECFVDFEECVLGTGSNCTVPAAVGNTVTSGDAVSWKIRHGSSLRTRGVPDLSLSL
jgi:hypothetical protein